MAMTTYALKWLVGLLVVAGIAAAAWAYPQSLTWNPRYWGLKPFVFRDDALISNILLLAAAIVAAGPLLRRRRSGRSERAADLGSASADAADSASEVFCAGAIASAKADPTGPRVGEVAEAVPAPSPLYSGRGLG